MNNTGMTGYQAKRVGQMRYVPMHHNYATMGKCLQTYINCRRDHHCNTRFAPNGSLLRKSRRQKRQCHKCIRRKAECLKTSKKHQSQFLRNCASKLMWCKKKCERSSTCRANCDKQNKLCWTDVQRPTQYYEALKK